MPEDVQWPGRQLGDLATYTVVSGLIAGVDARGFSVLPLERYGRWQAVVHQLFDVHGQGGHAAVFRRYLQFVYSDPDFALIMATLGMQSPDRQWQPEELPSRARPAVGAPPALPAAPAAVPRRKLPKNWSIIDVLTGRYDRAPTRRHAVREDQVYTALRELGEATVAELARHTGQDRGNVHRRVQKLLEQGMIERCITANAIVYRVRG